MVDKLLGVFFSTWAQMIIVALLGVVFKQFKKYKDLYKEILDVPKKIIESRKPDSNGGTQITETEYAAIGKEIVDVIEKGKEIDWKGLFAWIGKIFKKGK